MTTIPFAPNDNNTPPFSALVTLDGQSYGLSVAWNIYRGDWYFSLTDQGGNLVVNQPLIGSPSNYDLPLAPGLFSTSRLVYRAATGNFEIGP